MRIPLSKVYRAFPELDRFSDSECEGFVRLATSQYRLSSFGTAVVGGAAGLVLAGAGCGLGGLASSALENSGWGWSWHGPELVFALSMLLSGVGGGVVALIWYDGWLRRTIMGRLKELNCVSCSYPLLGLGVVDSGIICPECGQRFDLVERGLTPADLLSKPEHS